MPYADNGNLYYETHGSDSDPCIVLIAGIGAQLIYWPAEFINALVASGLYVVVFDNRDSGLSKHYDSVATPSVEEVIACVQSGGEFVPPYTLLDMAQDVVCLLHELAVEKAHIAGISMGGMVAQIIATKHPEKVLSLICIASSSSEPGLPPAKPEVMNLFFKPSAGNSCDDYVNRKVELYKVYNHPDYFDEKWTHDIHVQVYARDSSQTGFKRQLFAILATPARTAALQQCSVPSLIIHGDYDPAFTLEHGKQLAECIPGSKLSVVEKMGHGLPDGILQIVVRDIVTFIAKI
jgi:pimeloyl-ACP methyl ester carboxylesterase